MKANKESYIVLLSAACFMFSLAGTRPLIPLYSEYLGANSVEIGIIVAMFSLLPLFLSLYSGRLIDKMGPKLPLFYSICFGGLGLIVPSFLPNLLGLYTSQIMTGLAQMVFVIAMQSLAGAFGQEKIREFYVFIFSIGVAAGSFIGPLISGILSQEIGYTSTFLALGILLLLPICMVLFIEVTERNRNIKEEPKKHVEFLKQPRLRQAFLISALVLLGKDMYIAYFPLLAADRDISNAMIGVIISINAGAGLLIRFMLPFIIQKWSRAHVIFTSILAIGLIYAIHPLLEQLHLFIFFSFILGLCLGIGQPLSISATISELPSNKVGEGLGLRLTINKFTQVIMPIFLGATANVVGIVGVFYIIGFIVVIGSTKTKLNKS